LALLQELHRFLADFGKLFLLLLLDDLLVSARLFFGLFLHEESLLVFDESVDVPIFVLVIFVLIDSVSGPFAFLSDTFWGEAALLHFFLLPLELTLPDLFLFLPRLLPYLPLSAVYIDDDPVVLLVLMHNHVLLWDQ